MRNCLRFAVLCFAVLMCGQLASAQANRDIRVSHWPNAPVEIQSIKLGEITIQRGDKLRAVEGWQNDLTIVVKNVSDRPVSYVSVLLIVKNPTPDFVGDIEHGFGVDPNYDRRSESMIAPGETAPLTLVNAAGDFQTNDPIIVQVNRVFWDNDPALMWASGKLHSRTNTDPLRYTPVEATPITRYISPAPARALFMQLAVALVSDPGDGSSFCKDNYINEGNDPCASSSKNCVGDRCYIAHQAFFDDYNTCNPLTGDNCDGYKHGSTFVACTHQLCPITCNASARRYYNMLCVEPSSPIILDVLGDGYKLTDRAGGVRFDLNTNSFKEQTAWTEYGTDDSFLALDRDGNGSITNGSELFGDRTAQPSTWHPNGFLALAVFDTNRDGKISHADPVFASLKLWRDANHDGESQPDELFMLASAGITSISVDYKTKKKVDRYGNLFKYRAKVENAHGIKTARFAYDVFFRN